MLATGYALLILLMVLLVLYACFWCCYYCYMDDGRADHQPAEESAEQRVARAWAERQALAAMAEAALAARAEVALTPTTGKEAAPPPVLLRLPYFPYAAADQGDEASETTLECAICIEPLRPGQLCSEVPPCRHVFHGDCLGEWARTNGSCPLCRAKIVPESDKVAIADDMV